jgi:hypothetical protein
MLFAGEVWPVCFDWFTVIFRVWILLWFVVCLVLPVLQDVSEEEWKTCVFYALLCEFGLFWTQWMWRGKMKQTVLCYGKIWPVADLSRRWRIYVMRKMCIMKEKESVFRFLSKGKHFPLLKLCFLCWPELSFRWLVFHVVAKHEKTRKVNSRNSLSCNQTRPEERTQLVRT